MSTLTPIQIEFIRKFGSKELTVGCLFSGSEYINDNTSESLDIHIFNYKTDSGLSNSEYCFAIDLHEYEIYEILGHIPHLEDIFRVAEEKDMMVQLFQFSKFAESKGEIVIHHENGHKTIEINPTIPLLEQEEVMKALIELFSKI